VRAAFPLPSRGGEKDVPGRAVLQLDLDELQCDLNSDEPSNCAVTAA
jgi:hypothetical protein